MKYRKSRMIFSWSLLGLWIMTLYPVEILHSHEEVNHKCHLNCLAKEEEQGLHRECDHTVHIHKSHKSCFLCEFTFTKTFLANDLEIRIWSSPVIEPDPVIIHPHYCNITETSGIRGPPQVA